MSTTTSMRTAAARSTPTAPRRRRHDGPTVAERRAALVAGAGLALVAGLSLSAVSLLGTVGHGTSAIDAGAAFVAVGLLDVVVGCALYRVLRDRAPAPAHAAVVSRVGYAVLLAWAAVLLAVHGEAGVAGFRSDWSDALLVFGLHLVIVAVALWRSRYAPRLVVLATGAAGAAYLLDGALERFTDAGRRGALVPAVLGELALAGWLLWTGRRVVTGAARQQPPLAFEGER